MRLTVERLGHLGDGIARGPDGAPVFVAQALPGEVVEGAVAGGRMAAPRIVTPSPDRVVPPCPHYRSCGGCALMHAADGFVATWKAGVVRAALAAQGLQAPFRPVMTSPPAARRRATLAGRRTKKGVLVGFHGRASEVIVAVPQCRLLRPELIGMLPVLAEVTALGASRTGALALTLGDGGIDLSVTGGKPLEQSLFQALAALAGRADLARLSWDGEVVAARRPVAQRFGRARVVAPPGAFLQATAEGEAALVAAVREAVGDARRVADLFAGAGTFALPLAESAEVHAVEAEAAMLAALDAGWRGAPGLHRVTTEARDLFRRPLLPDELGRFDAVVIDPPRAGAEAQMREIAASRVATVAAVSCNPVTFARDARILAAAGFALDRVQVIDQFRWSPHVELAARFSRRLTIARSARRRKGAGFRCGADRCRLRQNRQGAVDRMRRRTFLAGVGAGVLGAGRGVEARTKFHSYAGPEVTQIVVKKGARRMYLISGTTVVKRYKIALGGNPVGPKQFEGDGKTPEGLYYIDRQNPNSAFYLSLGISYPNEKDRAAAEAAGKEPGSDIFIHGRARKNRGRGRDWTAGCIAVKDREIEEIYAMVRIGTPIFLQA